MVAWRKGMTRANTAPGSAARKAVYRHEYRRRMQNTNIPTAYRTGHGNMPTSVVERLEAGNATAADKRKYSKQIKSYAKKYGPPGRGRLPVTQRATGALPERDMAEAYAQQIMPNYSEYFEIRKFGSGWAVYRKRAKWRKKKK